MEPGAIDAHVVGSCRIFLDTGPGVAANDWLTLCFLGTSCQSESAQRLRWTVADDSGATQRALTFSPRVGRLSTPGEHLDGCMDGGTLMANPYGRSCQQIAPLCRPPAVPSRLWVSRGPHLPDFRLALIATEAEFPYASAVTHRQGSSTYYPAVCIKACRGALAFLIVGAISLLSSSPDVAISLVNVGLVISQVGPSVVVEYRLSPLSFNSPISYAQPTLFTSPLPTAFSLWPGHLTWIGRLLLLLSPCQLAWGLDSLLSLFVITRTHRAMMPLLSGESLPPPWPGLP